MRSPKNEPSFGGVCDVRKIFDLVVRHMELRDFRSFDSYDGFSSPLLSVLPSDFLKRAMTQLIKKGPFWLRPLFGIKRTRMVTTLAFALISVASETKYSELRNKLVGDILALQKNDGGWGYEFDVLLRWGKYQSEKSNLIATTFCAFALLSAQVEGVWKIACRSYLVERFNGKWFTYANDSDPLIHNANLLAAACLDNLGDSTGIVKDALQSSIEKQGDDGRWVYGQAKGLNWVDNFHTAYNLIALKILEKNFPESQTTLSLGLEFWLNNLFKNGIPLFYLGKKKVAHDVNSLATALFALDFLGEHTKATNFRCDNLQSVFWNQVAKFKPRGANFRWHEGPALLALSRMVR